MITFDSHDTRFTYRVAAIALHDGHVLLHRSEADDFWSLPGGRCEMMEPAAEAIAREMHEELGVAVTVERLIWIVENFFIFDGVPCHELGLYHLVGLPDEPSLLDKSATLEGRGEGPLRLFFRWFPLAATPDLRIYPTFLRTALRQIPAGVEHIVHHDRR